MRKPIYHLIPRYCLGCGKELLWHQRVFCHRRCAERTPVNSFTVNRLVQYWSAQSDAVLKAKLKREGKENMAWRGGT